MTALAVLGGVAEMTPKTQGTAYEASSARAFHVGPPGVLMSTVGPALDNPRVVSVILAPYLRVGSAPLQIGQWEAIPAGHLQRNQAASDLAFDQARGLLDLYQRSRRVPGGYGVFFRRGHRLVGEDFRTKGLSTLRRVILVALLDRNPSDIAGDDTINAGHQAWTSDNVDVIGHYIQPEGYVAARYGMMTQQLVGGLKVGDEHSEIAPPIEMPFPMMGATPDAFYCGALWDVLTRDTDEVRRLTAAIDWLDLAWRNTPSTTHDVRILILKSAFEALLGHGDQLRHQRPALSALMDKPNARRRPRAWTDHHGQPQGPVDMTDLEWWFTRFTFLRNAIAHGRHPTRREIRHGKHWQLWIAEYRLRQAIKEVVAQHGHPLVRMNAFDRAFALATQRYRLNS